jgi:hypothetical protein
MARLPAIGCAAIDGARRGARGSSRASDIGPIESSLTNVEIPIFIAIPKLSALTGDARRDQVIPAGTDFS